MFSMITFTVLLSLSALISAGPVDPSDFRGTGHISIIASNNVSNGSPAQKIGCLDTYGKVIASSSSSSTSSLASNEASCGVFTRLAVSPYTLSTSAGNCYYDTKSTPVAGGAGVPFWEARLGFSQTNVPAGHVEVLLLWEKIQ